MKRYGWQAVLLVLCGGSGLHAQFLAGPGLSIGGAYFRKNFALGFRYSRPFYANPYCSPFGARFVSNSIFVYAPPPVVPAPIVIQVGPAPLPVPQPGLLSPELIERFRNGRPAVDEPPPEPPEPPLPGREAGVFRPLEPDNRDRARQPVQPEPPPEKPEPPKVLPRPPQPDPDPRREAARQIELGKQAFAAREYGRAAECFRLAAVADPNDGLARLLLGQAQLALGKYPQAFAALRVGLNLRPDWPTSPFRPLDLYGPHVADYAAHLAALEDALSAHPDDGLLLFLSAYALWFDGRRAEARPLLERAAPVLPDRTLVERFLRALPGAPVV
jgi:hypothetical protein